MAWGLFIQVVMLILISTICILTCILAVTRKELP